jgi:hypothetical protein
MALDAIVPFLVAVGAVCITAALAAVAIWTFATTPKRNDHR